MREIKATIKLDAITGIRLQVLADQCGVTPQQMVSTLAVLALNRHLAESSDQLGPGAERPEQPDRSIPVASRKTICLLPDTGFLRLAEIVGRRPRHGQTQLSPLIPISRSTWLAGVKSGIYPKPIKIGRATAWRVEDLRVLIQKLGGDGHSNVDTMVC